MFHPDQRYDVRLLQQQDIQNEAARMRLAAQASEATRQRPERAVAAMLKLTIRYARYIFAALATVGFGMSLN